MESHSHTYQVPVMNSLDDLIAELHKIFNEERVNVEFVKAVLNAYRSNPKDWKRYAKFDQHRYTRNLVDEGNGKFNLMALCWGEGHGSSIHDHADAHCFVKVLDGQLQETRFDWPSESAEENEPLHETGKTIVEKNNVTYMSDELGLHRMENPSHTDQSVTLHLYCPPFDSCYAFDERTGHKNKCKVTFWSKYGKRTPFGSEKTECAAARQPENN